MTGITAMAEGHFESLLNSFLSRVLVGSVSRHDVDPAKVATVDTTGSRLGK